MGCGIQHAGSRSLETTEWLLLLLCRGFTPRPLLYLRIGRMQLEAVCDGIFQRIVSHAWMMWWLLYVRTSFCKQGEPGGLYLPTSHQGFTSPAWSSKPGSSQPSAVSGETGNVIRAWRIIQSKQNLSSLQQEPAVWYLLVNSWMKECAYARPKVPAARGDAQCIELLIIHSWPHKLQCIVVP